MVTPPLDVSAEAMVDAANRLALSAERTAGRLGWAAETTAAGVSLPPPVAASSAGGGASARTDEGAAHGAQHSTQSQHTVTAHGHSTSTDEVAAFPVPTPYARQRYLGPDPATMTSAQQAIHDDIVKTRPTTGISGPFGPWLANPALAWPSQTLGRVCR